MESHKESSPSSPNQSQDSTYNPEEALLPNFSEPQTDSDRDEESGNGLREDEAPTEERDAITETAKRTPGKPRKILTGKPGHQRKLYQLLQEEGNSPGSIRQGVDQTLDEESTTSGGLEANLESSLHSEVPYQ